MGFAKDGDAVDRSKFFRPVTESDPSAIATDFVHGAEEWESYTCVSIIPRWKGDTIDLPLGPGNARHPSGTLRGLKEVMSL